MRAVVCSMAISTAALASGCECDFFDSGDPDGGVARGPLGAPCEDSGGCRTGLVCDDGVCDGARNGAEGDACQLTVDCMDGLYCAAGRSCAPAGEGGEGADCASTGDCVAGLVCVVEGFSRACRATEGRDLGAMCSTDLDCAAGASCLTEISGGRRCQSAGAVAGDAGVRTPSLPLWPGASCAVDRGPPTAYFTVPRGDPAVDGDFYRLPYPNDVRRTASGLDLSQHPTPGVALAVDVLGRHLQVAEEDLDGFSTNPVIYFRFSQPYEWSDIDASRLSLIDITPSSPEYARNLGRSWLTTAGQITRYICPNWLSMRRGHGAPLRPGTTYAAVLRRGVRTGEAEGRVPFERSPDLDALLSDAAPPAALSDAHAAYAPLREYLASAEAEITADDVLNVAVFTTQEPTSLIPALRDRVRAEPPPALTDLTVCDATTVSPCDDGDTRACGAPSPDYWEIHARLALPRFQQGTPPFEAPEDGGAIARDGAGAPTVAATEPVCVAMIVPKAAPPPDGFPLLIYGHGTNGSFTSPLRNGVAGEIASGAAPAAVLSFDLPLHGSRRGSSTREPSFLVFNFTNPRAARDTFAQGAADLFGLVRWAETFALPAAQAPGGRALRFDPGRIAIWGHSQGANHAALMLPYEPGVRAAMLSGLGGDLTESLLTKTNPIDIASAVPLALLDPASDGTLAVGDHHPALALIQAVFDSVDPVNFGRYLLREPLGPGRHLNMSYGLDDTYSTERTMSAYARSVGLPHVAPVLVDIGLGEPAPAPARDNVDLDGARFTAGVRQYEPEPGDDGHFVSFRTDLGRADALRFLREALAGGAPAIGD